MDFLADTFLLDFPEFNGIVPVGGRTVSQIVQRQLDIIGDDVSENFGTQTERAVFLQTAHHLSLRHRINLAGYGIKDLSTPGISSGKQVAGQSVSEQYAMPANLIQGRGDWRAFYSRTTYGLEYLALCDKVIPTGALSF